MDLLNPPGQSKRIGRIALIVSFTVVLTALLTSTTVVALEKYDDAAIEWSLVEPLPTEVEPGESFTVTLRITNEGMVNLTGGNKASVNLVMRGGEDLGIKEITLPMGQSTQVNYNVKINSEGDYELLLNAWYRYGIVNLYNAQGAKTSKVGDVQVIHVEEVFNWIPVLILVVAAVAIIGVLYILGQRKKKAEEAHRIAEEARRQILIQKKEEVIAKKIEVRNVIGKNPREFYVMQRAKYAHLRPAGMTSSGLNILRRDKTRKELDAERKIVCPKCGTELATAGAECPRCNATEKIESVRHKIRTYKSRADVDFSDAEALLRKAEHRISWSDFDMANELVDKADSSMGEAWEAGSRGLSVEHKVVEYSDSKGPTLDAKVIGLEGEDVAIPRAPIPEGAPVEGPEETAGESCAECGHLLENGECHLCNFDEIRDRCWSAIEDAEMDGAKMNEIKDVCRQAVNAKERGSDELAVRYLRRAITLAEDKYHEHARSKTDGIIQFTIVLIGQLKQMGEEVELAEQMMEKAMGELKAGNYEAARSLAAKADGYLKQMKDDSYRKRINEILTQVEAGAESNPEVQALLVKAKKLIDAKELEGATDILELAFGKL